MSRKLCTSLGVAAGLLFAMPGVGSAAVTFGSAVGSEPISDVPASCVTTMPGTPQSCTLMNTFLAAAAGVAPGGLVAPSNGVITRWRVNVAPVGPVTSMTITPRVFTKPIPTKLTATRSGTAQTVPPGGGTLTFDERLIVSAGDYFGLDITTIGTQAGAGPNIETDTSPSSAHYMDFSPPLPDGSTMTVSLIVLATTTKLQINADLEPDIDFDGFGDETQDKCPQRADIQAVCPPPTISAPTLSKGVFKFTSDIAAKAQTTLFKVSSGRKVGKKCKTRAKRGKKCKIYTKFAQWNDDVVAGANQISYAYKIGGKKLKRGSYRATIVITSAQNTVTTKTVDFKIKK